MIPVGSSSNPIDQLLAITPHNTTDLEQVCRGVYVGGAGNMAVVTASDQVVTLMGVTAGTIYPIRAKRINSTNTTATNLVALY